MAFAVALMFAVLAKGRAAAWGRLALLPILAAAAVAMILHATAGPVPPGPPVVTFDPGQYTSYGVPSFTVNALNDGTAPVTLHTVRVRFVNDQAPTVITEVTERAGVTVPPGQSRALTYPAPGPVVNTAAKDWGIGVTAVGWS